MSDHRRVPEPGEVVYQPRSSWAPVILAFALALTVCNLFSGGFMLPGWFYVATGAIVALFAFRSMAQDAIRSYYKLPRKQHVRGAVLPVEQISPPRT